MLFKIAVVTLNQWALDFEGNTKRIIDSIVEAHNAGAIYRVGPELEICGYSVEDGFFDEDTCHHCWQSLLKILEQTKSLNIVIDVGMPVHSNSLYNCRVICYKGRILFIRAKTSLAKEGIYREYRYFSAWPVTVGLVPFKLPYCNPNSDQQYVPLGSEFVLDLHNSSPSSTLRIGWEICQELWDIRNVSSDLYNDFGCHLIVNSSGSYWELRKLNNINTMIQGISLRAGACYAYSNLVGCDGQRYVFSGKSCIYDRGSLVSEMQVDPSHLFCEKNIIYHEIDPVEINEYRAQQGIRPGNNSKSSHLVWNLDKSIRDHDQIGSHKILHLTLDHYDRLVQGAFKANRSSAPVCTKGMSPIESSHIIRVRFEEEINCYVSLWLWDYLRRSNMYGFMVPLSGGLDSSCVVTLVYCLCHNLFNMLRKNDATVLSYFHRVHRVEQPQMTLDSPEKICHLILKCSYLSTCYSGKETENRAKRLCDSVGARFSVISIQEVYEKSKPLQTTSHLPTWQATLLDSNLQARLRMTITYYLSEGNRIVLATGNVDEAIMGYLTKYDCSSADINPIGGLCKEDLKNYLTYCCSNLFRNQSELVEVLREIIAAPPSAELTGPDQRDEDDMGLTYDEIAVLGKMRRGVFGCCGPRGAFMRVWQNRDRPPFSTKIRCLKVGASLDDHSAALDLGNLIKLFYQRYARNRHKLTVLTPALHAETYSPDDNRFDHRQILFPPMNQQFDSIDEMVCNIKTYGSIYAPGKGPD